MVSPSGPRIFNGSNTKAVHFYSWPMGCFLFSFSRTINSGFLCLKIFIGIWLIYNVVLVTGVQKSESVIYIHISTLFQILFLHRPLQSIEQSSLCYTVGPHQLSILYIAVCICQSQSLNLSLPPLFPIGNHKFVFCIWDSVSVL